MNGGVNARKITEETQRNHDDGKWLVIELETESNPISAVTNPAPDDCRHMRMRIKQAMNGTESIFIWRLYCNLALSRTCGKHKVSREQKTNFATEERNGIWRRTMRR